MTTADTDRVIALTRAASHHEGLPPPALTHADLIRYALGAERLLEVLVAEVEGEVIGHVAATRGFDVQEGRPTRWLADLYVEPRHRRSGVGRRLVAAVAALAVSEGAVYLQWMVSPGNTVAARFYDRLGARADGGRPLYFRPGDLRALAAEAGDASCDPPCQ